MKKASNRRRFLSQTIAASAAAPVLKSFISTAQASSPSRSVNEQIQLGIIGIGPRCIYDLKAILPFDDVRCVAIADVQANRRDAGKKLVDDHYGNKQCDLYRDFRQLLDRKDIDAVLVATGDRWHARASILAAQSGKDVYSEKPCGITIGACQELADTIQSAGRIFQAGTQRRSVPNFQKAVELVHTGKLGKLHTMYASVYVPVLDNSWLPSQPIPNQDIVDWNLWLGPSPWRPLIKRTVMANGVANGTLTRARDYLIGALTRSIFVSGQINRIIRCRSNSNPAKTKSFAAIPTGETHYRFSKRSVR